MSEQSTETTTPPASPSPSTSGPAVDESLDPGRVGPMKLSGTAPKPLDDSKPARVGPDKLRGTTPTKETS